MARTNELVPTLESIKSTLIESLDKTYDLTYVDYRDTLNPDQVSAIVRNDSEALNDSIWEWESENMTIGARFVALEVVNEYESNHVVPEDFDASEMAFDIEEHILNRNSSDPVKELASHTSDVFMRVELISEDDGLNNWTPQPAKAYLTKTGLPITDSNLATMEALIADTPSDLHMGYAVFYLPVADLLDTMGTDATVTVENPEIILGNPFTGGYWNANFDGTLTMNRADMVTDKSAFGWSVDETYGGFITEATATISPSQEAGHEQG